MAKDKDPDSYESKLARLEIAKAGINKKYGEGAIMRGSEAAVTDVEVISTRCFPLDLALGVEGIPKGRITEIFGPEGLGKSLLAQNLVAECQANGGLAAYVDIEHGLDRTWALKQGVDWDNLELSQPSSGEEALGIVKDLLASNALDLIVVDSVAALVSQAEINGDIGDSFIGLQARLMGQALRVINPIVGETDTALVFINQVRDKIGPMANGGTTTSGGRALKFYAAVRIDIKHFKQLTDSSTGEITGRIVQAKILKNRVAPPFKVAEFKVVHGVGIDNEAAVLEYACKYGLVHKSGAFYYAYDENGQRAEKNFAQGEAKASIYLRENPEYFEELKAKVANIYRERQGYFTPTPEEIDEPTEEEVLKEIGEL